MKQLSTTTSRLAMLLGAAAIIAVLPVRSEWRGAMPTLSGIEAMAKGGDSSGGDSSGSDDSGGDDSGSDDSGSDGSGSGSDDGRGGSDDGSSDDRNDDSGRNGAVGGSAGGAGGVVKFEAFGTSVEVVYADGTKEEISGGRYERKNAAGRTVEERAATAADRARLMALR